MRREFGQTIEKERELVARQETGGEEEIEEQWQRTHSVESEQ